MSLEQAVNDLVTATTALTNEVTTKKQVLDDVVDQARDIQTDIHTNWQEKLDIAAQHAATATTQAGIATDKASEASGSAATANAAKTAAELARDAAMVGAVTYPDEATGRAAVVDGEYFKVIGSGDAAAREYRRTNSTTSVLVAEYPSAGSVSKLQETIPDTVASKNLLDKSKIVAGEYVSASTGNIGNNSNYRRSGFIPVQAGKTYSKSGTSSSGSEVSFFATDGYRPPSIMVTKAVTMTAPAGSNFAVLNITNAGQSDTSYDDTAQFEESAAPTEYAPFTRFVEKSTVLGLDEELSDVLHYDQVLEVYSFNLIDPAAANYTRRLTGDALFANDTLGAAASDFIPVKEGEFYTLSGDAIFDGASGGVPMVAFFDSAKSVPGLGMASFVAPVSGDGWLMQVPTGIGVAYVVVNLWKAGRVPSGTTLDGNVQLEAGEMATPYQPYTLIDRVRPELLPGGNQPPAPAPSGGFNSEAWYKYTNVDDGHYLSGAFPVFRRHWFMKDKDLCVVNTGTSLTARSIEHCTAHPDAPFRPPLMHSNNMASILWDRLKWEGQEYRRYDSGYFSEIGTFSTESNLPEWDDGVYRSGLTRYADGGGSISFSVPAGAWQFNFIYRTDSVAAETNEVSVAEGAGLVEVYDEAASSWVEANGFVFSMREAEPVPRSILVPRASDGTMVAREIPSKGNTTYQKRLKMRCKGAVVDSRGVAKSLTIASQGAGRFNYWGVEWSVREFMITYVNAARGSHNTQADSTRGLPKWQDNEIWSFKPDLLFFELPIHNDGAASAVPYNSGQWARLTDHFVFREDYELSLRTRGQYFGLEPEIGMFTSSISWNFNGINEDGTLKIDPDLNTGKMMSALDKYNEACLWVWDNHPEAVCINAAKRWVDAGMAIFGDMRSATEGSGKAGNTFTNEGSHWNDTGSKIIAKALVPLFDFTHP